MRKYVIGGLIGFMLSIGVGAHAEVINMIGKVIDGSFPIKINGKTLTNPALTIEGVSYVPTREFAESLGARIKFDADMGIEVVPSVTPATTTPSEPIPTTPDPTPTPSKEEQIKNLKDKITRTQLKIDVHKESIVSTPDSPLAGLWQETVAKNETELANLQTQLNTLQQ